MVNLTVQTIQMKQTVLNSRVPADTLDATVQEGAFQKDGFVI